MLEARLHLDISIFWFIYFHVATHLTHFTLKGNCVEAFSKYGESLDVMRRVYGADHPSIADTLKSQANVHEMLGEYFIVYVYCAYICTCASVGHWWMSACLVYDVLHMYDGQCKTTIVWVQSQNYDLLLSTA